MAIISEIGRKSPKVRILYFFIYTILILGSASMIYPFLLMISGSTKSAVDIKYFDAIPRFIYDDEWLYKKYIESLFNEKIKNLNQAYNSDYTAMENVEIPSSGSNHLLIEEFNKFASMDNSPLYSYTVGHIETPRSNTMSMNLRKFKKWLKVKYGDDILTVNRVLGTEFVDWNSLVVPAEEYLMRRNKPIETPFIKALNEFKTGVPSGECYYFSIEGCYKKDFVKNEYSMEIENYNKKHDTKFKSYDQVHLYRSFPKNAPNKVKQDWEYFVRNFAGIQYLSIDKSVADDYHAFLKAKHQTVETLNKRYETSYKSIDEVPIPDVLPFEGMASSDWDAFIIGWKDPVNNREYQIPIEKIALNSVGFRFQNYMRKEFSSIDEVNKNLGTSYTTFADISIPQRDIHFAYFKNNKNSIKFEFIKRNYITVSDYILFHGRGVINTIIYCSFTVLAAIMINPLAAYAMSRFKLPSTYKILLFLLCTMAFPPMVTGIPNFLMLRRLGLLNTFAALILPMAANGYYIFLLKGFFDSQPQELYESAQLDGASEWTLFWQIAMSLSKPVLAVIALQAFNIAYADFMMAFVVCQDEKMWTLMVWLYQLQQRSGKAVMYASLIIAAIPTLMIFLFCQNMIMRGIVVPSEK